jgi:DNA-directed RNA polymerase subunit beta'
LGCPVVAAYIRSADILAELLPLTLACSRYGYNDTATNLPKTLVRRPAPLTLGHFLVYGDFLLDNNSPRRLSAIKTSGQLISLNQTKITLRGAQPVFLSPNAILHAHNGAFVTKNTPLMTLPFQVLTTGDIVQGIPKIEQFFEARTTKNGRFFKQSMANLLIALFQRYKKRFPLNQAVRQSFYKIQQIIIDGVQRVYRSQGVTIADKHIEIIVKQMTRKVLIVKSGQTGFLPGELLDLEFVEKINSFLVQKIKYKPIILGITKASLEVDSFLSASSFQQTTKVLSRAAIAKKRDFLLGLKENVILGNLIPAGTGYFKE